MMTQIEGKHANGQRLSKYTGERRLKLLMIGVSVAAILIISAGPAPAQQSEPPAQTATEETRFAFDIPAQPLQNAVTAFGFQSGYQVAVDQATLTGLTSKEVRGNFTPTEALSRLLAGTGVTYRLINENSVTLMAASPGATNGSATVLSPITIEGQFESAHGPVDGYVATRSAAGTKTDTALIETPQSISVITADELKSRNVNKFNDALRYTPGVESELYGLEPRFSHLSMRGLNSSTTGLFKDGVALVNPGYIVSYNPEPWGAERIEVPRGPASVLYGQGSPGGLINYVTKRPTTEAFGVAHLETGNYNRKQIKFDIGGAVDEKENLALRLAGLFRRSDTQFDFLEDNRLWIAPSLSWQPVDSTKITLFGMHQQDDTGTSQALPGIGTLFDNPNRSVPHSRYTGEPDIDQYDRTEYAAGYEVKHEANPALIARHKVRYHVVDLNDDVVFSSGFDGNRTLSRSFYSNHGNVKSLTADTNVELKTSFAGSKHTLLGGIDIQYADMKTVQNSGTVGSLDIFTPTYGARVTALTPTVLKDFIKTQYGVYAQNQIELGDHWRFTLSGRYDWAITETDNHLNNTQSTQRDEAFTGRAGMVYLFDNGIAPYASYSESFLPITDSTNADGDFFEPETGQQYEIGVKYQPTGSNSFVTASAFDLRRQNYTEYDSGLMATVQTGEVRSRGIEVEALASFDFGLDIKAGYTHLQTEVLKSNNASEVGKRLILIPEHKATLWAEYTVRYGTFKGLGLGAGIRYQDGHYGDAENTLSVPGHALVDAAVHYEVGNLRFGLNAQNLFDKEHLGSCYYRGPSVLCTVGEGLVVTANVSYSW